MATIAILITCHNRKAKTIFCIENLFNALALNKTAVHVFLVDDGSTDGTTEAVKNAYPQVNIIQGNGKLFWNQGMRLAWNVATKEQDFDYYLWLNDDTILNVNAIEEILSCSNEIFNNDGKYGIFVGSCQVSEDIPEFSYGGKTDNGPVIPNGKIQNCKYINGNVVLVPRIIFQALGNLSNDYTHAIGDNDYGLRAIQHGFECYTTKTYIATCQKNDIPAWCNPEISLIKRIQILHSPKGLNIREYNKFRKKFWGHKWLVFAIKAYLKTIFPNIYSKL